MFSRQGRTLSVMKHIAEVAEAQDLKPLVCLVCGRASNTGHHYGVTACLGCKTFFRRVVVQGKTPRCKADGRCPLQKNSNTKRICRSCRYWKCKEIGMKEEALHPCRDLIGRRKDSLSESSDEVPSSTTAEMRISPTAESALSLILRLRDADADIRANTAILNLLETPTTVSLNDDLPSSLRAELARLRQWVEQVPGFSPLTSSTKRFLLHRFCLMFIVVESGLLTARLPAQTNLWYLSDGSCLTRDLEAAPKRLKATASPQTAMEQQLLLPLTGRVLDEIADPLRKLQPSDEEIAALKGLMLMKPTILRDAASEVSTEEDRKTLGEFRDNVLRGLHVYYRQRGEEHPERRLSELIMLSGPIEICAAQSLEYMHMLRFFNIGRFDEDSEELIFGQAQPVS